MRGYDRVEVADYDEYDDYEDEEGYAAEPGEEEEEEGYEEAEEEERKPTAEELKYLELRQQIKERIRKKMQKENGSALSRSQEKEQRRPFNNFGSFFGPSQPVIAQRVIQESKSLLENPELAMRVLNRQGNKQNAPTAKSSKNGVTQKPPKVANQLKMKVQKLRDARDYSFLLSDDAQLQVPSKVPTARSTAAPRPQAQSAQFPQKSKPPPSGYIIRSNHIGQGEKKAIPSNGNVPPKVGMNKSSIVSKPNSTTLDSRRQLGSNNGSAPGRLGGPKGLPPRTPVAPMAKQSAPVLKSTVPSAHKAPPAKTQSSVSRQHLDQKRPVHDRNIQSSVSRQHLDQKRLIQERSSNKMITSKPVASSRPQINKPLKQMSSQQSLPKKKPVSRYPDDDVLSDDDMAALRELRKLTNYRPDRFRDRDLSDSDDDIRESTFDELMMEEKRSAKIARQEDEEQLRLIEEEERQERMRKLAKKRKLSQR